MNIDDLKSVMDGFDPAALLPDLENLGPTLISVARWAVMIGPVLMLVLGLLYLFVPAKEANYYYGYRCYFGMGSVDAWRYTQRIAGFIWALVGLVLTIVMLFVSGGFVGKTPVDAMYAALGAILWEAAFIAASCVGINMLVAKNFTSDGEIRRRIK